MTVKTYKQLTNHNTTIQQHSTTPGDAEQHTGTVKTEILREYECVFKRKMESAVRVRSAFAAFMQHCKTRLLFTILITFFLSSQSRRTVSMPNVFFFSCPPEHLLCTLYRSFLFVFNVPFSLSPDAQHVYCQTRHCLLI